MISLFKKKPIQEAQPLTYERRPQPPSNLYNEVMKHQHEMRKQLYREIKLK
jgi:hypothetical protein